jgi:hypothetical protein
VLLRVVMLQFVLMTPRIPVDWLRPAARRERADKNALQKKES